MLGSDILNVAIGLVFVYLLMSLIATAAREALEGYMKKRGLYLEQGLIELFEHETFKDAGPDGQPSLLERFYKYPLIFSLFRGDYRPPEDRTASAVAERRTTAKRQLSGAKPKEEANEGNLPSYIPSKQFANAILGVAEEYLKPGSTGQPLSFDRLTMAAWAIPNDPVRKVLLMGIDHAKGDLDQLQKFLANWYDGAMDRVSGWYRRQTQAIVFFAGLVLCVALNVNTMVIGHALSENAALRQAVGVAAQQTINGGAAPAGQSARPMAPPIGTAPPAINIAPGATQSGGDTSEQRLTKAYQQLQSLGLPIGWGKPVRDLMWARLYATDLGPHDGTPWVSTVVGGFELVAGWLMTALAITLGAPFWFDILNTMMVVRSTVKPAEKSPTEGSKDAKVSNDPKAGAGATAPPAQQPAGGAAPAVSLSSSSAGADEIASLSPTERPREEDPDEAPAPDGPAAMAGAQP